MPPAVSPFQSHLAPQSQQQQHLQQQMQQQHQQQQQQNIQPPNAFFPSLHLYPLNESFVPKQIALAPQNGRVKIGRQTNAKTVPGERNGYFDSKVLSRQHAEIWEEGGKIYIKDVKSSNGTFINGERLSPEGVESEPFELKSDDTVEFGIDIVGEDNKTIIHHKVAAKVFCIFTPDDLQSLPLHQGRRPGNMQNQLQTTNQLQNSALGGMGAPRVGKSGLTFDHILNRLQAELAKSRETGSELNQLTGTMVDIQDTLGGSLQPSNLPPYPSNLPPVRPPVDSSTTSQPTSTTDAAALTALQTQLHDTQSTLQSHLDKIRHLEGYVAEQEALKRDISHMQAQIDERKQEVEILLRQRRSEHEPDHRFSRRRNEPHHSEEQHSQQSPSAMDVDEDSDDDDNRSVATAVPEDRDGVGGGNDSEDERDQDERRSRRHADEFGRPRTPEPTGHMSDDEYDEEHRLAEQNQQHEAFREFSDAHNISSTAVSAIVSAPPLPGSSQPNADLSEIFNQNAMLATRLETLTSQLESAMELSKSLQSQAMMAQSTIAILESKVGTLEMFVNEQQREKAASPSGPSTMAEGVSSADDDSRTPEPPVASSESMEVEAFIAQSRWDEWRERVEGGWKTERETWDAERQRLATAVKEWEIRTVDLERKEGERREKEEAALERARRQQHSTGFGSPSSDEEDDHVDVAEDGDIDAFHSGDKRLPTMVNGFTSPRKIGGKANGNGIRRRKPHSKTNGIANGVLPSPVSSPSSSISSTYAAAQQQRRGSESPTTPEHHHHPLGVMNGKLPISPPNTSPPRSIAHGVAGDDGNDDDDDTEEPVGDGESSLGLVNGHISSSQSSLPSSAANTDGGKGVSKGSNSFVLSAQSFADRNGLGSNSASPFTQMFGGDYVSRVLSSSFAWISMASAFLLFVWTITDIVFLFLFPSFRLTTYGDPIISDCVADLPTCLSSIPRPLLLSTLLEQPLPYISAASMVVIGIATWTIVNRERMGV
ncbi:hypothetical protein FRB97_007135 [Tulasnella sp. 331]|nr:hypothetical protein FRB97_007135 [Tulasnella sp. 331]